MKSRHTSGINTGPMELPDDELESIYGKPAMDSYRRTERKQIMLFWAVVAAALIFAWFQT